MSALWPAALAAVGVAVSVGLPLPRRVVVRAPSSRRRREAPRAALPVLVAVGGLVASGPVAALLLGGLAFLAQSTWVARRARRERAAEVLAAAEAMAALAAELRVGRVPADAFAVAAEVARGPTAVALRSASAAVRWGSGPGEPLHRQASASAVPEMLRGLAACWQVCSGTGSSFATAVDRLEEGLRLAGRQRDLVESEVAQARASAAAMACLPAVGVPLGYVMGGDPLHVLLHTPVGIGCLALGLGLDLVGLWWTRRLVAAAMGGAS